jgi:FtsZ-binding cell division protein ZapB
MSIFERLNPLRIVRAVDAVPHVQSLVDKIREDQKTMSRQLKTITRQLEQLEQTMSRQEKVLAGIPDLQAQVQRCVTAYTKDARQTEWLPALRATLGDGERFAALAAAAVARAQLERDPFPHIVIDDLLPDDVSAELLRAIPSSAFFKTENMKRQELEVPFVFAPEYSRIVWGMFFNKVITETLVRALTDKFMPALDEFVCAHWPSLGSMAEAGISLRVSNSRLLLRRPGYVIKPHRDPRWAFLTCLVYLPRSADHESYGTQLYRLRQEPEVTHNSPLWVERSECELVKDVPARRNTALVFLNSTGAHGASIPSDAPAGVERYLFQVQFGVDDETKQRLIAGVPEGARSSWAAERNGGY